MCTVTFIPAEDGCYITSNRDEKHWRKQAVPPREYTYNGQALVFPKDADAGGTWIAMNHNGDAAVLLNGAFKRHTPAPPYRKSRGLVFLDILSNNHPEECFDSINLDNIQPFTLVLYVAGRLVECRWDGQIKYSKELDCGLPHIWSSSTLYDDEVVKRRELWFAQWLAENPRPSQQQILDFHCFGGDGDTHNDLRMNRQGSVFTVSITSMAFKERAAVMHYADLQTGLHYTKQTAIIPNMAAV